VYAEASQPKPEPSQHARERSLQAQRWCSQTTPTAQPLPSVLQLRLALLCQQLKAVQPLMAHTLAMHLHGRWQVGNRTHAARRSAAYCQ
jgi:hypothetical protein